MAGDKNPKELWDLLEKGTVLTRGDGSRECSSSTSADRITNLVSDVIDNILVKLPIKDAARTSILSRKWRYRWHSMSKLVFGRKSLSHQQPRSPQQQNQDSWQKLARIVDGVLVLHNGPIREFSLVAGLPVGSDVDRWMIYLMRAGINCLTLWFSHGRYRVTSHLFACDVLDRLILHRCELRLPISFKEFSQLRSLKLCSVSVLDDALGELIVNCPCLEQLVLIGVEGCRNLEFAAPNLVKFFFYGVFDRIRLKNSPSVNTANIGLSHAREKYSPGRGFTLDEALGGLQRVKKFFLEEQFLQFLALNCAPETRTLKFEYLRSIHFDLNFASLGQTLVLFCLLRCSPSLHTLTIKAMTGNDSNSGVINFWETDESMGCSIDQLAVVEISRIIGAKHELRFIKFILANAPLLKTFKVNVNLSRRVTDEAQIFKELLRYQRASVCAQIIYTD